MFFRRFFTAIQNQIFYYCALIAFFAFFVMIMWGDSGILQLVELRHVMRRIDSDNESLLRQNLLFVQEIDRLKNDPGYAEQRARSLLGYVRQDETVFYVPEE